MALLRVETGEIGEKEPKAAHQRGEVLSIRFTTRRR